MPRAHWFSELHIINNAKLTFIFRLLIGLALLIFGASKLPDLNGFVEIVMDYKILPGTVAHIYGITLPWAEVAVGLFLILGLGLKFVAPIAILIIASFIAGTAGTLYLFGTGGP